MGLRARKLAWWLDAPRPLRAVVARGLKFEASVVALPSGCDLPPAAFPRGSVLFCAPLLGQFNVRRVRFDITGKDAPPIELMKRTLRQGDAPLFLSGGSCHEFRSGAGIASAFLQVALLPPTSNLRMVGDVFAGDGSIGWRRPPGEACDQNDDVISGAAVGVQLSDLMLLERQTAESVEQERQMDKGGMPSDTPQLLKEIGERVGGLDDELSTIVRRALASRLYPPELLEDIGVLPVRGMLLFGPPGCGKTLLAREISRALGAREPKIVNGPEMMSKYVGESENFIRALFAEARLEQEEAGSASLLHVVVFDEIDAFTRERGSLAGDTSGIRDSVVNQLLAIMDGVNSLNNVLVIGLTNRKELMDPALLRPGRLEVQVCVQLPDECGRQRIAAIHSSRLRQRGALDARAAAALSSGALAATTAGFSGADIAGLMRSATSFALERYVDSALLRGWEAGVQDTSSGDASSGTRVDEGGLLEVQYDDLVRALREVEPSGSERRRGALAKAGRKVFGGRQVRAWLRESKLRRLTDRAMREAKSQVSES